MKKYAWDEVQSTIENRVNSSVIFFVCFTKSNDIDSLTMLNTYEEVEEQFKHNSNVKFMNVDTERTNIYKDINDSYKIWQSPKFIVIYNNKVKRSGSGIYPKEIIIDFIEENLE